MNNNKPARDATLMVATCNALNLAQPGRHFYNGQKPYSQREFDTKLRWLGQRFKTLNADVLAVASLRSLLMRAGEALALRLKVVELLHRTRAPLVLMGDLNDSPHSVTTQLFAATSQVAYDRSARYTAFYSAWDVQGEAALRCAATWPTSTFSKATRRCWIKFWLTKSLFKPAATPSAMCAGWRCSTTTCSRAVTAA